MELNQFIANYVTMRSESMFLSDIEENREPLVKKIKDKSILVIGGAGSIGSSYVKAVLEFLPKELIVVDINENALAELTRDLRSTYGMVVPDLYIPYPFDYSSPMFEKMFRRHGGFDIVANFSAHKHVRSEKDIYSIEALLNNNVIHLTKLLELLKEYPPEEYFCVSTDKAANPVNIMGASKRIMEDVIFSYSDYFPVKTARFANVAFSNGSLPAGFVSRMAKLQPISAPTDVTRYFVSPEESGHICMLACMLGRNREIFFPKLREEQMMSFDSIAENYIRECGYELLYCASDEEAVEKAVELKRGSHMYPVHFSGSDTSGEKEYEEFYVDGEAVDVDRFRSLGVIIDKDIPDMEKVMSMVYSFESLFLRDDVTKEQVVAAMEDYLPMFRHIEKGKSLDSKM